jgi:hypothetical protein
MYGGTTHAVIASFKPLEAIIMQVSLAYPTSTNTINTHVSTAQHRSVEWAERLALIQGEPQKNRLHRSKIAWLVGRVSPTASLEGLQVASDWTTLFCLMDDRIEDPTLHPIQASALLSQWLRSFREGTASQDAISQAFADLHQRMRTSEGRFQNFLSRIEELCLCFSWEAIHRRQKITPDLETYLHMREISVGIFAELALSGFTDGIDLPLEILEHPSLKRLMVLVSRVVGCANDLFTYEKELQQGELHNLVHVLMTREQLSKEEAISTAIQIHDDAVREFHRLSQELPTFEGEEHNVRRFVSLLERWMSGHLEWAKETGRYRAS